jgi:hypothetical protein
MEIWVEFDGNQFRISPDPAVVNSGTPVIWKFQSNTLSNQRIRWEVYFSRGSPFHDQGDRFTTTTTRTFGQHAGATGAMSADDPGDYKYGVRAIDLPSRMLLGDDDPYLEVR